ncbi:endonuclease I family protein [Elusimicrobiota bacterium]
MRWGALAALLYSATASFLCPPLNAQQPLPTPTEITLSSSFGGVFAGAARVAEVPVPGQGVVLASPRPLAWIVQGEDLLAAAHELAKWGHSSVSYSEAKRSMFSYVDGVEMDGVRGVIAYYSWIFVPGRSDRGGDYREQGDLNGDGYVDKGGMNAEHVWPQSYFKQRLPMRSDLHNLLPTFMHPNSVRGRLPFCEVPYGEADYATSAGARRGNCGFEPPDMVKGRVARSMLYFYTRYLGYNILPRDAAHNFWNSRIELLLRWNREFPPDALESHRNDLIEQVQGNRNPYVDDPDLADRIGAESFLMRIKSGPYASSGFEPLAPRSSKL